MHMSLRRNFTRSQGVWRKKLERRGEMPAVWLALRRSLNCKSEPADVHDPKVSQKLSNIVTKKIGRSGCSRSIANLKDVIHGSKRHIEKPSICSPRSIGSSELQNTITHEVVISDSTCELKITNYSCPDGNGGVVGSIKPGTPGPGGGYQFMSPRKARGFGSPVRRSSSSLSVRQGGSGGVGSRSRSSFGPDSHGFPVLNCHKCGEQFTRLEALELHHLTKHAVTELVEGDSSRKIVEIICRANSSKTDNNGGGIDRILKVHCMQKTLAQFEEYREIVKIKANKLPKRHPRCLADGNELLRFYGTTVECCLGLNGSSKLCTSDRCNACRILRHGFSTKREFSDGVGVFTASTSSRALECIELNEKNPSLRKALIVCRVIAGRVHKPLENIQEIAGQSGFDSLAGKVGLHSNIEELYLLNPKALLPCFVVISKL